MVREMKRVDEPISVESRSPDIHETSARVPNVRTSTA